MSGVDELLCQLDPSSTETTSGGPSGKAWYPLTDAQGDIVSMAGLMLNLGGSATAQVAGQWTYSPYGQVLSYDNFSEHPALIFGHKSLAVDRLDEPALVWEYEEGLPTGRISENQRLVPGARLIAYARNRTLDIDKGRWLQMDPNSAGAITLSPYWNGERRFVCGPSGGSISRARESVNIYSYICQNPIDGTDALGLFTQQNGYAAEAAIQEVYKDDHKNDVVQYGKWTRLGEFGKLFRLKPDILNTSTRRWAEIKPFTPCGIAAASVAIAKYGPLAVFQYFPDTTWAPSTHFIEAGTLSLFFWNCGGIIFYTDALDTTEDLLALVTIEAAKEQMRNFGARFAARGVLGAGDLISAIIAGGRKVDDARCRTNSLSALLIRLISPI
ncbi:MAG: hypothetical protein U0573_01610 [Phycisphaerales bacterium]